jgi:DNA mismatch endonuclease (patch repair protein)
MSRIRSHDTSIELAVRRYLYSRGYRYRLHSKLAGRPDLVFPRYRIAVFVNGCFWHMHGCRLSAIPSTRRDFWIRKLEGNRTRDAVNLKKLSEMGWTAVTLWECELEVNIENALSPLLSLLRENNRRNAVQ